MLRQSITEKASDSKARQAIPRFAWNRQTERQLKELWATGDSGDAIAAAMHPDLTRSAVLGKIDRMRKADPSIPNRVENGRASLITRRIREGYKKPTPPKLPGQKIPKLPQLQQPPVMKFTDAADLDMDQAPRARTVPLPPITPERVQARHKIEAVHEERRLYSPELRCICGKPGAVHCDTHKQLLEREGVL